MQFIDITEPEGEKVEEFAVGIDFGTTNSLITIAKNGNVSVIPNQFGQDILPSIISAKNNQIIAGDIAGADYILPSIKRLLGKSTEEILSNPNLKNLATGIIVPDNIKPQIIVGGNKISLLEAVAEIFRSLKKNAETYLNNSVNQAVVTVPAYFDDASRGSVMLAANIAGFKVLRLIAEPTAAAYAYGIMTKKQGCYLVYDLGGGTFDVSLLKLHTGVLQVIATGGDNLLGGDDIDTAIAEYLSINSNIPFSRTLIQFAKKVKHHLTREQNFSGYYSVNNIKVDITLAKFNQIITPLIQRTIDIAYNTWLQAEAPTLDGIILVGGSSKIPLIYQLLKEKFNSTIYNNLDPEKVVSYGAAMQAENLTSSNTSTVLIDVLPLSLGLELYGGINEKIVLRNSPIPLTVTQEFTTYADNQTAMQFHILQGEREMATDCRSLAKFEVTDIPPMKAGKAKIEVQFSVDTNGILSVSALEKETGNLKNVTINPTYALSAEEIDDIIVEGYKNAEADHKVRLLQEAIVEAEQLLYELDNAIIAASDDPVIEQEKILINDIVVELKNAISQKKRDLIVKLTKNLTDLFSKISNVTLNRAVSDLLVGKNIDEVD